MSNVIEFPQKSNPLNQQKESTFVPLIEVGNSVIISDIIKKVFTEIRIILLEKGISFSDKEFNEAISTSFSDILHKLEDKYRDKPKNQLEIRTRTYLVDYRKCIFEILEEM